MDNGSISKTVNMYGHEYILILQLSIEAHSVCCFWRLKYDANPVNRSMPYLEYHLIGDIHVI